MTPDEIEKMKADMDAGTPGPWFAEFEEEDDFEGVPISDGSSGAPIANVPVDFNDREDREANARRIARVPQLEAEVLRLREALRPFSQRYDDLDDMTKLRAIGTNIDMDALRAARAALSDGGDDAA